MRERVIISGFGGQGILFLGKALAQAGMSQGRHVTYFPAYGPEVRGGRANCHVILSSAPIYSPMLTQADAVLAMNQISWDYFAPRLRPGGVAVLNASMVALDDRAEGAVWVPATDIANDLGDVRATNMVMLGAYTRARDLFPLDVLLDSLGTLLTGRKAELFELNRQAILKGIEAAEVRLSTSS